MPADVDRDDAELVRASQRGDREAFGLLVTRHAPSVLSVTSRMLGSAPDAEDVAQETFVAAYRAVANFQFGSKFSTWLYGIAVNKCRDALRARRPPGVSLDAVDQVGDVQWATASLSTPLSDLEQVELGSQLASSIGALPLLYRESFVLRHLEGLDYDEMSTILGVHRDTLKMRVYKARTLLCQSLAHLECTPR